MNYCTDQWLVVKYPGGAGGKFLINCLFLFDNVAHWHGIVGQQNTVDYFRQTILDNSQKNWLKRELNHHWNTSFFSRSYSRNNHISCDEFNQLTAQTASEYFHKCWESNQLITEHWAKPTLPIFWQAAKTITIMIDDWAVYQNLVYSKLYRVEDDCIISLLDCPTEIGTISNYQYAQQYQNQWKFPKTNLDEFFDHTIKKQPWLEPWINYNTPDGFFITLTELLDLSKFLEKFEQLETYFNQTIDKKYLIELHNIWSIANDQFIKKHNT